MAVGTSISNNINIILIGTNKRRAINASTIKAKIDIDLNINIKEKTPLTARKCSKFQEYFSLIWKKLDFKE